MRLALPWMLLLLLPILKILVDHFRNENRAALSFSSLDSFRKGPRTLRPTTTSDRQWVALPFESP